MKISKRPPPLLLEGAFSFKYWPEKKESVGVTVAVQSGAVPLAEAPKSLVVEYEGLEVGNVVAVGLAALNRCPAV